MYRHAFFRVGTAGATFRPISSFGRVGQYTHHARAFSSGAESMHGTTILCVRKGDKVVLIGDGQISLGNTVIKGNAIKVRRLGDTKFPVLAGYAGATADAMSLLDRLEKKIEQYPGQLTRACVELAKLWRTDKYLRRLEAMMIVVDENVSLTLTGNGDVIQSPDGIVAIGSGGSFALSAARALMGVSDLPGFEKLDAEDIAKRSMEVASDICVYTNKSFRIESLANKAVEAK